MTEPRRIRLGELLLRAGVIQESQLRSALAEQKKWGGKLGSLLLSMNFLDEDMLVKALSKQLGLPRVDFSTLKISQKALDTLDPNYADHHQVLPISLDADNSLLVVAMAEPDNLILTDEIAFRAGCRVSVVIAGETALANAIRSHYFGQGDSDPTGVFPFEQIDVQASSKNLEELDQRLSRLETFQEKEVKVLKTLVELLINKGLFSRGEYLRKIEEQ
jgi:hypothetical protein